jgi:hypothetical protein
MDQAVNLTAMPSQVRILLPPLPNVVRPLYTPGEPAAGATVSPGVVGRF